MVHMPLVERIGLDNSIPIGLRLWAVCGIVSHVLALETLDVTQVLWCLSILTVASIATIRIAWLLMRSRVVLATIVVVLPLAVLNSLLLAFQHNSFVYEPLAVSKSRHCQLDSQLIIQPL